MSQNSSWCPSHAALNRERRQYLASFNLGHKTFLGLSSLAVGRYRPCLSVRQGLTCYILVISFCEEDIRKIGCLNNMSYRLTFSVCGVWFPWAATNSLSLWLNFSLMLKTMQVAKINFPSVLSRPAKQLVIRGHLDLRETSDFSVLLFPAVHQCFALCTMASFKVLRMFFPQWSSFFFDWTIFQIHWVGCPRPPWTRQQVINDLSPQVPYWPCRERERYSLL